MQSCAMNRASRRRRRRRKIQQNQRPVVFHRLGGWHGRSRFRPTKVGCVVDRRYPRGVRYDFVGRIHPTNLVDTSLPRRSLIVTLDDNHTGRINHARRLSAKRNRQRDRNPDDSDGNATHSIGCRLIGHNSVIAIMAHETVDARLRGRMVPKLAAITNQIQLMPVQTRLGTVPKRLP